MPLITAVVLVLSTCMLNVVIDTRPQFLTYPRHSLYLYTLQEKTLSPKEKTDRPIKDKSRFYYFNFSQF